MPLDILRYGVVVGGLTEILNFRVFDARGQANHYSRTYLAKAIKGVIEYHNAGDLVASKNEFMKLAFLLKHLREIKDVNLSGFNKFRSALLRCKSPRDFYGLRLEIYAAASLTRAGVFWEKRESPDFKLLLEPPLYIECVSAHISGESGRDSFYKIGSAIAAKGKKPYANSDTILFLDITNLVFNQVINGHEFDRDKIRSTIFEALKKTKFGAAVVFSYSSDDDIETIRTGYFRVDGASMEPHLLEFMNNAYPIVPIDFGPFVAMSQG
jgi:hypothetical protein